MIQTGDPTGTGKGGQSIWGRPFEDEIRSTLKFNSRGIVAMANAGPDTNKSQVRLTLNSILSQLMQLDSVLYHILETGAFGWQVHHLWTVRISKRGPCRT